jgi:hypothetical protein
MASINANSVVNHIYLQQRLPCSPLANANCAKMTLSRDVLFTVFSQRAQGVNPIWASIISRYARYFSLCARPVAEAKIVTRSCDEF